MGRAGNAQNQQIAQTYLGLYLSRLHLTLFNSLPNRTILEQSTLKAFADDISHVVQIINYVSYRVENIVGKGKNASYDNVFKSFPFQMF